MRLRLNPRAERLIGRIPRPTIVSTLELALLIGIAVQGARLFWIVAAPVGPVGLYQGPVVPALPSTAVLGDFDPFFRLVEAGGPAIVTSLNLKLHGVREDRATGRGSAIIALPDGSQRSFLLGEEIMPGVTLAEVRFDSISINRNGSIEQIFLDQSGPTDPVAPVQPPPAINPVGTQVPAPGPTVATSPTPPSPAASPAQPPASGSPDQ